MSEQIKRLSEVKTITGLSSTTIYRMAAKGTFPSPIKLGVRSSGWVQSEIQHWVDERIKCSRRGGDI